MAGEFFKFAERVVEKINPNLRGRTRAQTRSIGILTAPDAEKHFKALERACNKNFQTGLRPASTDGLYIIIHDGAFGEVDAFVNLEWTLDGRGVNDNDGYVLIGLLCGTGWGSHILEATKAAAVEENVIIALYPENEKLERYYWNCGFRDRPKCWRQKLGKMEFRPPSRRKIDRIGQM